MPSLLHLRWNGTRRETKTGVPRILPSQRRHDLHSFTESERELRLHFLASPVAMALQSIDLILNCFRIHMFAARGRGRGIIRRWQ